MPFGDDFITAVLGGGQVPVQPKRRRPAPPVLTFTPGPVTPPAPAPKAKPRSTPLTFTPGPVTPPAKPRPRPKTRALPVFIPSVVAEHPEVEVRDDASLVVSDADAEEILEAAEDGDDGTIVQVLEDDTADPPPTDSGGQALTIFLDSSVGDHEVVDVKSDASLVPNVEDSEEILEAAEEGDDDAIGDILSDDDVDLPPAEGGDALEIFLDEIILEHPDVTLTDPAQLVPNPEDSREILEEARDVADEADGGGRRRLAPPGADQRARRQR